ncbi:MAG TPA: threonine/serine dehydratase [Woeseiaceae bacterium]
MSIAAPDMEQVSRLRQRLQRWLIQTPVVRCRNLEVRLGNGTSVVAKLEFLQRTGTFKPRGALSVLLGLDEQQLRRGVTAVSAGNHAIATAFAARAIGTSAKVVMLASASPVRVASCRRYGAEVVLADDVHTAFALAEQIRSVEGRHLVHPFEGPDVVRGTATVGLEIFEQVPDLDAVIVPIGGGGLCAGIAGAMKQLRPECRVFGVEPEGADSMHRSFLAGAPMSIDKVRTIADSLGAPFALPLSYSLCREFVDELALVSDDELRDAMGVLFTDLKVAVEPACAASTAALLQRLSRTLAGKRVVLVLCGSNIDWSSFEKEASLGIGAA